MKTCAFWILFIASLGAQTEGPPARPAPEIALQQFFHAVKKDAKEARALLVSGEKLDPKLAEATIAAVAAKLRKGIAPTILKSHGEGDASVIAIQQGGEIAAIFALKRGDSWRVFPGLGRYAVEGIELTGAQKSAFGRLEMWYQAEKKSLIEERRKARATDREVTVRNLLGVWRCNDFLVKLEKAGTFFGGVVNEGGVAPGKFSGRWELKKGALIWHYELASGSLQPRDSEATDTNPITKLTGDSMVLKEIDGSTTEWIRSEGFVGFEEYFKREKPAVKKAVPIID